MNWTTQTDRAPFHIAFFAPPPPRQAGLYVVLSIPECSIEIVCLTAEGALVHRELEQQGKKSSKLAVRAAAVASKSHAFLQILANTHPQVEIAAHRIGKEFPQYTRIPLERVAAGDPTVQ